MRDPDLTGLMGKAWRVAKPGEHALKKNPSWSATLACWLLTVPSAHPVWHSYQLALIHLRNIDGVPPAYKKDPAHEYEVLLEALDPEVPLPDPDDTEHYKVARLTPPNLVEQFHGVTDEKAVKITELLARSFLDGINSPDTDYLRRTLGSLHATILHFALGDHPRGSA